MRALIMTQLRHRRGRSVALLLSILVATTGFTVLTGTAEAARLQVIGEVSQHYRGAYDIIVRPAGSRSDLEESRGLVEPNFLGSLYGGISIDQWQEIAALPGVDVAAPVAMLGYARTAWWLTFDVTDAVDPSRTQQVIRVKQVWYGDGQLSRVEEAEVVWTKYVTRNPVAWPLPAGRRSYDEDPGSVSGVYSDGLVRDAACPAVAVLPAPWHPPYEILPDGREVPICLHRDFGGAWDELPDVLRLTDRGFEVSPGRVVPRLTLQTAFPLAFQVAAVDPRAEARLVGLDDALAWGKPLEPRAPVNPPGPYFQEFEQYEEGVIQAQVHFPALVVQEPPVGESVTVSAHSVAVDIGGLAPEAAAAAVAGAATSSSQEATPVSAVEGWREMVDSRHIPVLDWKYVQPGPVAYDVAADGTLVPRAVESTVEVPEWEEFWLPEFFRDSAVRSLTEHQPLPAGHYMSGSIEVVGGFDASLLRGFDPLAGAPLDTYAADIVRTTDGSVAFGPTSNPGGYLLTPPSLLISIWALPWLDSTLTSPVSAVRVRVAGIDAFDDVARERVRVVADQIAALGFDVDIMLGSSASPQLVALPAGEFGRPALTVEQMWTRKGVAGAIVEAIDRKSVILFGLILVVCALTLGNAVMAAVRSRQSELAILSCVGWSRRRLASLVLGELLLLGLAAGVVSAGLAYPVAAWLDVSLPWWRALLAVPVALLLCVAAAALPVLRGSRVHPAGALRPTVAPSRRRLLPARSVLGVALAGLTRVPGRALVAVAALAVGVAGLTVLTAVTWNFHGNVVGSVLGEAISVQVRGVDMVAVLATVGFGLFSIGDVLYLNVRERRAEHAALRAVGWSDAALMRLVVWEGLLLGLLGTLTGAGLGLLVVGYLVGSLSSSLLAGVGVVVAVTVPLTAVVALVPALATRRNDTAAALAEA